MRSHNCFTSSGNRSIHEEEKKDETKKKFNMVNVKLDGDVIKKCFIGKVFPSADVNSITFSQDGTNLLASNQADQILVINSEKGTQTRVVNTNKYGVGLIQFANCNETAIYCSTKINDDIRLLNIPDTKYVRYFVGHKLPVISLDMCPEYGGNAFLSTSLDRTLRIWDTRAVNHQSILHAKGHVIGAYDREGITFAAGIDSKWIKLYDSRYFERGPFSTFQIDKTRGCQWQKLKFAPDGRTILITTRNSLICQIDAYTGSVQHIFTGEFITIVQSIL